MSSVNVESTSDAAERRTTDDTQDGASSDEQSNVTIGGQTLSKDVIFDVLKNQRRRRVLSYLREQETTTLSDVAEHVAALETDKEIAQLSSSERKRVYVGLYQCHLPRMDDADLIEFDRARGTIELRDSADVVFPYLDLDPGEDGSSGSEWFQPKQWLASLRSPLFR